MTKGLYFWAMSRTLNINLLVTALMAAGGLLAVQAVRQQHVQTDERRFSEQVDLALRQTADHLLRIAGDRSSTIPPVEHLDSDTWLVRLSQNFEYDSLPPLLRAAFAQHRVVGDYNVAIVECTSQALILGYTVNQLLASSDNEIACMGRDQEPGCYNLRVTFSGRAETASGESNTWILFATLLLSLLAWLVYILAGRRRESPAPQAAKPAEVAGIEETETASGKSTLQFGRSALDIDNQKLVASGVDKDLTYRETKLLLLFCTHANQLLERDRILKLVWEDEGVLVGRSVDVFVSRLRKLLKEDPTVKFVNVHGVGYRMEVSEMGH